MAVATRAAFTGAFPDAGPRSALLGLTSAPEAGWTWFNQPNAFHFGDRTFIGWISGSGHPMAAHYDHSTKTLSTPARLYPDAVFEVDDHDDPALIRRSDGHLLAYFSVHGGDDQYVNVSTDPDDASAWDGPVNIGAAIAANTTTYMAPVQMPDGTIRLHFRDHYDGVNAEWAYSDSPDGETFSGHTSLVRTTYMKPFRAGNRIHFVGTGHPQHEGQTDVLHFYWEGGSYHKSDGALITASLPLAASDLSVVYDGATSRAWLWDIAVTDEVLRIAFSSYPGNDGSDHRANIATWDAGWTVEEVAAMGGSLYAGEPFYSGGIALDRADPAISYVSRQVGSDWHVFRYPGGAQLSSGTGKHIRPKAVQSPRLPLRVLWMSGTYTTYLDWSTGLSGGF